MKSFVAASILALVGASAALPSTLRYAKRDSPNGCGADPGSQAVINAINQWNSDVETVNAFLELAASSGNDPSTLAAHIGSVISAASDEPNQLQVLACEISVSADPDTQDAVNDLFNNFGNLVVAPLEVIQANINDASAVQENLATVNQFRCCNVLPDLDKIWLFDADDEGVSNVVIFTAPRPSTCAGVPC